MKNLTLTLIVIFTSLKAYAQSPCQVTTFPFQQIKINSNECVQANYNFTDSTGTHPLIFCYQSNPNKSAVLTWPYKGSLQSGNMPITIKINPIYSGEFADSSGVLAIQNNSRVSMFVACQYAFLK